MREFAVRRALEINAKSLPWNTRCAELWDLLNGRGAKLMAQRGVRPYGRPRASFTVASGS